MKKKKPTNLLELVRIACELHGEDESSILTNATPMQLLQEFDDEDPNVVSSGQICFWGNTSVFALDYTEDRGVYLIHVPRHPFDAKSTLGGRLPRD
jgi:hypothetical protein